MIYRLVMQMLESLDGNDFDIDDDYIFVCFGWRFKRFDGYMEMAAHDLIFNDGWRQ